MITDEEVVEMLEDLKTILKEYSHALWFYANYDEQKNKIDKGERAKKALRMECIEKDNS